MLGRGSLFRLHPEVTGKTHNVLKNSRDWRSGPAVNTYRSYRGPGMGSQHLNSVS